jgi:hypothetical protein
MNMRLVETIAFSLFMPLPCAASPLEQQFASCVQDAMRTYPAVDPYQEFVRSMHLPPSIFDRYLAACMRAQGFSEPESADPRCLDPAKVDNEAFCYAKL